MWLFIGEGCLHNRGWNFQEDAASTGTLKLVEAEAGAERWVLRHLYWLIALLGAVRLVLGGFTELAPDEAVYWAWSRHLAGGYLDHPPMIAVLNWLSTRLLGDREVAVRLPAVLLAMGTLLIIVRMAKLVLRDELAVAVVATVWVCSPMLAGFGMIFTPDTPAMFFAAGALGFALAAAVRMERGDEGGIPRHGGMTIIPAPENEGGEGGNPPLRGGRGAGGGGGLEGGAGGKFWMWVGFGVCCGLGLDSKYTVVLLPAAVGVSLLCSRKGRRELGRAGPWLAAVIALALFSPVVWWNATHHWASFLFQLHHGIQGSGAVATERAKTLSWKWGGFGVDIRIALGLIARGVIGLGGFVGGQALLWTPVLLGLSAVVLWKYWRPFRRLGGLGEVDRMLLLAGSAPLLLFAAAAAKSGRGEINWPALGYVPISLLLGRWLAGGVPGSATPATADRAARLGWMRAGWQVALGFTVVVEVLTAPVILPGLHRLGMPMPHSMADLSGWDGWAKSLAKSADGAYIVCNRHQDAAEATFYIPGRPNVWCDSIGTRPAAYDYFDDKPDFAKIDRVLYVGGNLKLFMAKYGYTHAESRPVDVGGYKYRTKVASLVSR